MRYLVGRETWSVLSTVVNPGWLGFCILPTGYSWQETCATWQPARLEGEHTVDSS